MIDLGVVVLEDDAAPVEDCLARIGEQSDPPRTAVAAAAARPEELGDVSHLLLVDASLVLHPHLLRLVRRALREVGALGSMAVTSSASAAAESCDGTPAAYQELLCTARRVRREADPIAFAAVPRELWLEHPDESLEGLLLRAEAELEVFRDVSGLLAVRVVGEAVESFAPPVPLAAPAPRRAAGGDWRLSVVMPLRDRPVEHLRASLAAWARQSEPPAEILVVDQRSGPEAAAAYRALARCSPRVRYLRCEEPRAWNKPMALNRGIRASDPRSTHVLTTDCDLLFHAEALAALRSLAADGRRFVHGHRCDLPDVLGELHLVDDGVWEDWASAGKVVDAIADPWHLMPREWAFEVRGFDERMSGRGYMDLDMSWRAGKALESLRVGPGTLVALHYPHPRPHWFRETFHSPETSRNRELYYDDPSIVRNDAGWGLCG